LAQAGNAMTVNAISAIAKNLLQYIKKIEKE
jgi:site-specific DNA-cytosine methylase